MIRYLFLLFFGAMAAATAWGQSADNPFELAFRLPKTAGTPDLSPSAVNPFDVVPHRVPGASALREEPGISGALERPRIALPQGNTLSGAAVFWVLILLFGFLTFSIAVNRSAVGRAWRSFLNDNALVIAQRDASGLVGSTPYYLLYVSFLLNAGLFMFLVTRAVGGDTYNNLGFLLLSLLGAAAIFLSKHLLLAFIGWMFPVRQEVSKYNFLIIVFNCVLGFFLLPFNFLLTYSGDFEVFIAFWALGLILVFYTYRGLRAGRIGSKFLAGNQFHFLLYLCIVEIAPVLFLVKLATIPLH